MMISAYSKNHVLVGIATSSFLSGMAVATYMLRLRDRERLRKACSRTNDHLRRISQRAALGPNFMMSSFLTSARKNRSKVIVIGAGSYGTAMANVAAINGHDVVMFMRDENQCLCINEKQYNPKYLSDYRLDPNGNAIRGICSIDALKEELQEQEDYNNVVIILALPCQKTPDWLKDHRDLIPSNVLLCSTAKGLYLPTKQLIGHAILDALDDRADQPLAFLSGPSFAEEIMKGNPTAVVVASNQLIHAVTMQKLMSNSETFRVYTSQDPVGVQLGGALKNPLAVGAGMINGCGFGINTLSFVVTRASSQLKSLCEAMGGDPQTIDGLSGIGDLMLTCFSSQSRNQRCGQRLVKGEAIEDIQKDYTVEGVPTAEVAVAYADMCGLELPLFRAVYAVIKKKMTPEEAASYLMGRPLLQE